VELIILIGLLAVIGIFFASCLNWRRSVQAVFLILVFEGALRKWFLPQAAEWIYFLKDLVILGAYLNYFCFSKSAKNWSYKNSSVNLLIFSVIVWCIFQAFNPSLGSPLIGFFGIKAYLFYLPLMWMLPSLFQSESDLYKFLQSHLLLLIPVGILGVAQFFSPPSSPLNVYVAQDVNAVTFAGTDHARITGTFSYIGGYAVYLQVCFGLLIPFLSIKQSRLWHYLLIGELLLVTVNSCMTGSRGVVMGLGLFLVSYLAAQGLTQPTTTLRLLQRFLVPAIIVALAASIWFRPAIDVYSARVAASGDVSGRVVSSFAEPFEFMRYKALDGHGIGATHQATPALRKVLQLPQGELIPTGYESEMGRVVLELGPIGFFLWYGLRVSILIAIGNVFYKLRRPFLRGLALSAFLIHLILLNGHLVFHHTFSVYYWFLSGFVFLLPQLEQTENWYRSQYIIQHNASSTYITGSPDS
jgi:hypothetical protein